ncbi:MAG: glutaredoxin family protein [Patescibacteria group bacterium]
MRKFFIGVIAATLLILGLGVFYATRDAKNTLGLPSGLEYYWSTTCPHCAKVQEFLDSWDGASKISLDKKEVGNPANSGLLVRRASSCNISPTEVGVPFLFTPDGKCIVGDEPIIEYLKGLNL